MRQSANDSGRTGRGTRCDFHPVHDPSARRSLWWGARSGALDQGRIVYPNARVILHPNKIAHWQVKDTPAGCFLITYADQIAAITDETPNGLSPRFLPSHTPGPMGLRMGSNLALVGDIFHSAPLELADPNILPALTPIPSAPAAKWP